MSDTRAAMAMREFRFLDEKRTRGNISPAEEARWNELRGLLGVQGGLAQEPVAAMDPAQQPRGYYGDDGQWYAYPEGYDPNQAYAAPQEPYPAQPQAPEYVQHQVPQTLSPVHLTLESESLDIPALSEPAPWAEPTPDPEPSPPGASPPDAAESLGDDLFEVTDTDVTPVSEATPEPESSEPMQLGEDDFSSLNPDLESPAPAPPVAEAPLELARTLEVQAADLEMLEAEEDLSSPSRPVLAEEPAAPLADEWASAPLAVDTEPVPPVSSPPVYDAMPVYDAVPLYEEPPREAVAQYPTEVDGSDAELESNRMEVTASYALPAYPPGNVAPFDLSNLQTATPPIALNAADQTHAFDVSEIETTPEMESGAGARPKLEMPWNTDDGTESPTFDVVDLGAEVETPPPAPAFPSEQHVPSLELHPVQVAPDLQADAIEIVDSFEPEAANMPAVEAQPEWNTSAEAPIEVQAEWTTAPAEPSTSFEAQPEWSAPAEVPAEAPIEVQAEWTTAQAEEQPVMEAQSEWAAPVEEQPVMEAQPEWAAPVEEQPVMEAQPEWAAPVEEQPVMEAQPEWAAPVEEQPVMEAQPEWAAPVEEQPMMEAQPEWAAPVEEQPVMEAQPEWAAPVEEQPAMEAQPEWAAASAAQDWNAAQTAEPQAAWNAPAENQGEWNGSAYEAEPVSTERDASMFGTSGNWSADESAAHEQSHWSSQQQAPAWGHTDNTLSTPVEELSNPESYPAPEPDLPIMEVEPEMPEIELSEDIVEPPTAPVPPPAPVAAPRAPAATQVLVPGAPPPRATHRGLQAVQSASPTVAVPLTLVDAYIEGEHRVIIHTVEGQVKRGAIRDVNLLDESIPLEQQTGFAPERIPISRVKAIFFMLATGSRPPQPDGQKVRVTFVDGRQVAGFSHDYKSAGEGFFVIPADTRTNTSRIFIYRASVQAVAEG